MSDLTDRIREVLGDYGKTTVTRPPPREVTLRMTVKIYEEGVQPLREAWGRFNAEAERIIREAAK